MDSIFSVDHVNKVKLWINIIALQETLFCGKSMECIPCLVPWVAAKIESSVIWFLLMGFLQQNMAMVIVYILVVLQNKHTIMTLCNSHLFPPFIVLHMKQWIL